MRVFRLILLFTLLPLVELSLLLRIGEWLGGGATIGLVIITGVVGAWLARREGARTWGRVQADLADGRVPGNELLHALLVFIAGVVLVTPGVITDLAGLLLLIHPTREIVARSLRRRLASRVQIRTASFGPQGPAWSGDEESRASPREPEAGRTGGRVVEVHTD
jgi:UPF0716 protein FxsA